MKVNLKLVLPKAIFCSSSVHDTVGFGLPSAWHGILNTKSPSTASKVLSSNLSWIKGTAEIEFIKFKQSGVGKKFNKKISNTEP